MKPNTVEGKCKNCRFWGISYDHECDRIGYSDNQVKGNTSAFNISANADDDQGLQASLVTGPDFGCVKFEARR